MDGFENSKLAPEAGVKIILAADTAVDMAATAGDRIFGRLAASPVRGFTPKMVWTICAPLKMNGRGSEVAFDGPAGKQGGVPPCGANAVGGAWRVEVSTR